jgi:hypothetical protein
MSDSTISEKIYALLLRLQSSQFRDAYLDESLQLFRDRARDEQGFLLRVRLWLDLIADLAISVPRGYSRPAPNLIRASAQPRVDGVPCFRILEGESLNAGALLSGCLLTAATLAVFSFAASHSAASTRAVFAPWSAASHAATPAQHPQKPQALPNTDQQTAAKRKQVIQAAAANLKEHYIDPAMAQKMADAILAHEKSGYYDAIRDGATLAAFLTKQFRKLSGDPHLDMVYSQNVLPEHRPEPTAEALALFRQTMARENCTFEKVEVLAHNIGYLKLNFFPETSVCQSTAKAAMASMNHTAALIFDLRDNRGGYQDMVALIASYLFDHPEYLFNPRDNVTKASWTRSPVSGNNLADKPVYILTSGRTASGAEQFSYDLKMLKRATLVGETTRGSAHAAVFHRLDEHFGMGITETAPINPFSDKDWEGVGVEPDVKTPEADALDRAKKLAQAKLSSTHP